MSALALVLLVVEVEVRAPSEVEFGTAFPLTVVRRWSATLEPEPWKDASVQPLAVRRVSAERVERDGVIEETLWFVAYAFARDVVVVGPVTFIARDADGADHVATCDPLTVIVESSLDAAAPGPIELPGGLKEQPFEWSRWTTEIAGAVIVACVFVWLVRRTRRGGLARAPRTPAHIRALDRLAAAAGLEAEPFYVAVSDAVRDFIQERYGVHAPEMTTEEFLGAATVAEAIGEERRNHLAEFLRHCDGVKFGRLPTTARDRESASELAERFVREATDGIRVETAA